MPGEVRRALGLWREWWRPRLLLRALGSYRRVFSKGVTAHFAFKKDLSGSSTRNDLSAYLRPLLDTQVTTMHKAHPQM